MTTAQSLWGGGKWSKMIERIGNDVLRANNPGEYPQGTVVSCLSIGAHAAVREYFHPITGVEESGSGEKDADVSVDTSDIDDGRGV